MSFFINHTKREIREADSEEIVLQTNSTWSNSDNIEYVPLYDDSEHRYYLESLIYDGYDTDPKLVTMINKRNKLNEHPSRNYIGKNVGQVSPSSLTPAGGPNSPKKNSSRLLSFRELFWSFRPSWSLSE